MLRDYNFSFINDKGDVVVSIRRTCPYPMSNDEECAIRAEIRKEHGIDPCLMPKSETVGDPF